MAIAFGGVSSVGTGSSQTSVSVSGSNTIGLVFVSADNTTDNVTAVTWNSQAMTKIRAVQTPSDRWQSAWYIVNPAAGATTIAFTGASSWRAVSAFYTGVSQINPIDSSNTGTSSSSTSLGVATTVVSSNCWTLFWQKDNNGGVTYTTSVGSLRINTDAGGLSLSDSNGTVATGSNTTTHSSGTSSNHGGIALSIAPLNTDTFYPDPNVETTSVDGRVWHDNFPTQYTWAQVHDNAGTGGSDTETAGSAPGLNRAAADNNSYNRAQRGIFIFDTSALPDTDTIDSGTFSLYCTSVDNAYGGFSTNITVPTTSANTSLTSTDYNIANHAGTRLCTTDKSLASGWTTSAYNDYTLNASGLSNISATGVSKFAHRFDVDIDYSTPTTTGSGAAATTVSFADTSGTTQDPKLVVVHSAAATTGFMTTNSKFW